VSASQLSSRLSVSSEAQAVNGGAEASAFAPWRPEVTAHLIRDDEEAIRIAHRLAENFAQEASIRDHERRLPLKELDEFSQSGLWGINVPKAYGGAEVSYVTVAEVIKIISAADPSIGQIPQNHLAVLDIIRLSADEDQKRFFFAEALRGVRLGNAFAESGSKTAGDFQTRLARGADGFVLNGRKFYCSGALLAHLVPVAAVDESGKFFLPIVERDAPGLTIIDDWSSFGQRTTASGTVLLENVAVPASHVVPAHRAYDHPTANGPICQIIHAAIDAGIAKGAIADTIHFVRNHTRPWIDSGQEHGYEDVHSIAQVGDLQIHLHAAEALLERAGRFVDAAITRPNEDSVAAASIAVAEAKALTTEIAILATNRALRQ
jgi:SfnB family sulfur acquisition oxidoreductase